LPLFAIDISIIIFIIDAILLFSLRSMPRHYFDYAISPRHFARFHQRYFALRIASAIAFIFSLHFHRFSFLRIDIFIIDISFIDISHS
jgi:hypothetical protein